MYINPLPLSIFPHRRNEAEVPPLFRQLVEKIASSPTNEEFIEELQKATKILDRVLEGTEIKWWDSVLKRCDAFLREAYLVEDNVMKVDKCHQTKDFTMTVLKFYSLLLEVDPIEIGTHIKRHLLSLLESSDMDIIAEILKLLPAVVMDIPFRYKDFEEFGCILRNIAYISRCWVDHVGSVKMVDCFHKEIKISSLFPFVFSNGKDKIVIEEPKPNEPLLAILKRNGGNLDEKQRYALLARVRMLRNFENPEHRMKCAVVHLLASAVLFVWSSWGMDEYLGSMVFNETIDEETADFIDYDIVDHLLPNKKDLIEILRLDWNQHVQVQTAALTTMTAIHIMNWDNMSDDFRNNRGISHLISLANRVVEGLKNSGPWKPPLPLGTKLSDDFPSISYLNFIAKKVFDGLKNSGLGEALFQFIGWMIRKTEGEERKSLADLLLSVVKSRELDLELFSLPSISVSILNEFRDEFDCYELINVYVHRLVHELNECRKELLLDVGKEVMDLSFKDTLIELASMNQRCNQHRLLLIRELLFSLDIHYHVENETKLVMESGLVDALAHVVSNIGYYSESVFYHAVHLLCGINVEEESIQLTNVLKSVLSLKFIGSIKERHGAGHVCSVENALEEVLRTHPFLKPFAIHSFITAMDCLFDLIENPPTNTKITMPSHICMNSFSKNEDDNICYHASESHELLYSDCGDAEAQLRSLKAMRAASESKKNIGTTVLPLGDFFLMLTKIAQTVLTSEDTESDTNNSFCKEFIEQNGIEKVLLLSQKSSVSANVVIELGQLLKTILSSQKTSGAENRLICEIEELLKKVACKLENPIKQEGASYLMHLGKDGLSSSLNCIAKVVPILEHCIKRATKKVIIGFHDAWLTDPGQSLFNNLLEIWRCVTLEASLIRVIRREDRENRKREAVLYTQEEWVEIKKQSSISNLEVDFWKENEPLADLVLNAEVCLFNLLDVLAKSCSVNSDSSVSTRKCVAQIADKLFAAL